MKKGCCACLEIEELAVHVSADSDWARDTLHVALLGQNLASLLAELAHLLLAQLLPRHQRRNLRIKVAVSRHSKQRTNCKEKEPRAKQRGGGSEGWSKDPSGGNPAPTRPALSSLFVLFWMVAGRTKESMSTDTRCIHQITILQHPASTTHAPHGTRAPPAPDRLGWKEIVSNRKNSKGFCRRVPP